MKWIYSIAHGNQQLSVAWTLGIIFFSVVTNDVAGESSQKSYSAYSEHPQSNPHFSQDAKHIHPTDKEWTKSTVLPWDVNKLEQPNIVPLALKDETFKHTKQTRSLHHEGNGSNKNAKGSSKGDKKSSKKPRNSSQQYEGDHSSSSSSKGPNGKSHESKSHRYSNMENESSGFPDDLPSLQEKTLSLGKLVLEFLRQEVLPRLPGELSSMGISSRSQERSMPFADTFASLFNRPTKRQGEGGGEGGGGVINRNQAIGWLARIIGVDGKTLGEFLREYQVHVLYDLVFTFFKWIFFLYAGLLIP